MPKTRETLSDTMTMSLRLPQHVALTVKGLAKKAGITENRFVRNALEDLIGVYGLPAPMIEVLRKDCKEMQLDLDTQFRDYVLRLLLDRYDKRRLAEAEKARTDRGQPK
ncbi:MAG: hypothetical protein QM765_38725 [Myxococcales bacterium]